MTMYYVLCTMYYVLCTMYYVLCTMTMYNSKLDSSNFKEQHFIREHHSSDIQVNITSSDLLTGNLKIP